MRPLGLPGAVALAALAVLAASLLPLSIGKVEPGGGGSSGGNLGGGGDVDGKSDPGGRSDADGRDDGGDGSGRGSGTGSGDGQTSGAPSLRVSPPQLSLPLILLLVALVAAGIVAGRWFGTGPQDGASAAGAHDTSASGSHLVQPGGPWSPEGPAEHIARAYRQACVAVTRVNAPPSPTETPTAFAARAPGFCHEIFHHLTILYLYARYEGSIPTEAQVQQAQALNREIQRHIPPPPTGAPPLQAPASSRLLQGAS